MLSTIETRGTILVVIALVVTGTESFSCLPGCVCTGVNITCTEKDLLSIPEFRDINGANIVDLSGNQIEEIDLQDLNWKGIEQLQFLYLNLNSIVFMHEKAFVVLRNLEYLDLSNNYLEYLPSRMFETNGRLATLNLAGNFFGNNVPAIVSNTLLKLDLSFAKITHFGYENVKHLPKLRDLNLQANNIVYINPAIFNPEISVILSYNTWACNCSTIEVYNWAAQNRDRIEVENPIKCMNSKNYIQMFNRSDPYPYKESCNIDEATFGIANIKKLSLIKGETREAIRSHIERIQIDEDEEYYARATALFSIVVILIVLLAVAVGGAFGFYFAYLVQHRRRHNVRTDRLLSLT